MKVSVLHAQHMVFSAYCPLPYWAGIIQRGWGTVNSSARILGAIPGLVYSGSGDPIGGRRDRQEAGRLDLPAVHRSGSWRDPAGGLYAADQRRPADLSGGRCPGLRAQPANSPPGRLAGAEDRGRARCVLDPGRRRRGGGARAGHPGGRAGAEHRSGSPGHRAAGQQPPGAGAVVALRWQLHRRPGPGPGLAASSEKTRRRPVRCSTWPRASSAGSSESSGAS